MKTRAVQIFEEYIQSEKTREQYMYNLKRFTIFNNLESVDLILSIDSEELKQKIEDYVILFKNKGNSSSYIRTIIFSIQSFCESNDKMGEANKALDYLVKNCDVSERAMKILVDYNQNIYDSLDMYKNTTPHSIPDFGDGLSSAVLGIGMMGVVFGIGYAMNKYNNRKFRVVTKN